MSPTSEVVGMPESQSQAMFRACEAGLRSASLRDCVMAR